MVLYLGLNFHLWPGFGGYSHLAWSWMPYRQLVQLWWLVLSSALVVALLLG